MSIRTMAQEQLNGARTVAMAGRNNIAAMTVEEKTVEFESGYDREVVDRVWSFAQVIPGNDPAVWRKDEFGAWLNRMDYRNRGSEFGWEIADCGFSMRAHGVAALRPMQWQNYLDFMVASRKSAVVTADGLRNVRRLI